MKVDSESNSSTNTCNHISELFSPAMDDELEPEERKNFYLHLEACSRCRAEFDRWNVISNNLKRIPVVPVPPDFTQNVMAAISKPESRSPGFTGIFRRRSVAAAAAGIMLLAGSMGSYGLFKTYNNSTELAAGKQIPPAVHQQYNEPDTPAGPGTNKDNGSAVTNSNDNDTVKTGENSKPAAGNKQPATNSTSGTVRTGVQAGQNNTALTASGPAALLSEKVMIDTRLIKIQSGNAEYVAENVDSMLAGYKVEVQKMVNQTSNGRTTAIIRIMAGSQKAGEIAAKLAALGNVLENSTDNKDITAQYQQALARQQELTGLLDTAESKEKQNYQHELDALSRQIKEWNEAASGTTIVFWIES